MNFHGILYLRENTGFISTMLKCHILVLCATRETHIVINDARRIKSSNVIAIKIMLHYYRGSKGQE